MNNTPLEATSGSCFFSNRHHVNIFVTIGELCLYEQLFVNKIFHVATHSTNLTYIESVLNKQKAKKRNNNNNNNIFTQNLKLVYKSKQQ
jgi:hypothetical protein